MSLEDVLNKMRAILPDMNRKRRRSSNCVDSGPPPKLIKNVPEHRFVRDDPLRLHQMKRTFLGSMGSIFSKFKSHSTVIEPTESAEYSDGEDYIVLSKYKKSDLAPPRTQQMNNYQPNKMYGVNHKSSSANKPLPGLIPKTKWSRVPDLQKIAPARLPRVNGYPIDSDTSNTRNGLVNGNSLSFQPHHNQHFDINLERQFSNYTKPACTGGPRFSTLNPMRPTQSAAEEKLKYEKLLKSVVPEFGQSFADVVSGRPPISRATSKILDDAEFQRKQEDIRRRFDESSIHEERKVTPINTTRLKLESSLVFKESYADSVKEKYSALITQRDEKINQQQETSNKLSKERQKHCISYKNLIPQWRQPDFIIFDEDIEEKVDDFPEFTDNQKQTIRNAMTGNSQAVVIQNFGIKITREYLYTLQWDPISWLNDEIINFYMNLLTERGELRASDGYPKVYAMNTFFTQRLCGSGYAAVKRWTKKVDIFACDIIPVPVHVSMVHWCMAIINMKEKTIKYYDSMGAQNNRVLSALEDYLREESLDKRKMEFDLSGWSKENVTDNPRQENGSDCGVFSCMTAEFICRNRPIVFSQQHMNYFRQRMVLEISTGKMLL